LLRFIYTCVCNFQNVIDDFSLLVVLVMTANLFLYKTKLLNKKTKYTFNVWKNRRNIVEKLNIRIFRFSLGFSSSDRCSYAGMVWPCNEVEKIPRNPLVWGPLRQSETSLLFRWWMDGLLVVPVIEPLSCVLGTR
jgi:hypothetical protein